MSIRQLLPLALLGALPLTGCIINIGGDWDPADWEGQNSYAYGYQADRGPLVRGDGERSTEARSLDAFDAVKVAGWIDVEIHVGQEQSVQVHGDSNLLGIVQAEVRGGSLELRTDRGRYRPKQRLWVEVNVPDLRAATVSGSSDLTVEGLDRGAFALAISGSGDARVSGRVNSVTVDCSGSGDADLSDLSAHQAAVVVSGSSGVLVDASDRLDVSISGSGEVRYQGQPQVAASVSGSGDVLPR
jgi:Putative auto-transporter adhesin, head GIN domain